MSTLLVYVQAEVFSWLTNSEKLRHVFGAWFQYNSTVTFPCIKFLCQRSCHKVSDRRYLPLKFQEPLYQTYSYSSSLFSSSPPN